MPELTFTPKPDQAPPQTALPEGGAAAALPGAPPTFTPKGDDSITGKLGAFFRGALHGLEMTGRGVEQLADRMPSLTGLGEAGRARMQAGTDQGILGREAAYQALPSTQQHPIASGIGRFGGEMAATAPLALVPGMAGARAASLAGKIGAGAVGGGIAGAAAPTTGGEDYWGEKLKQVGLGMGVGGAIPGVGGALAPRLPSPQAVAQGVSKAFRPLATFISGAEERTVDGFDRTIARQVLEPIGGAVPRNLKAGHGLLDHTENAIGSVYNRILPQTTLSREAAMGANQSLAHTISELAADEAPRYATIMQNRVWSRFPEDGMMDGQTWQRVRTDLGRRGVGFLGTNNKDLGHALLETLDHLDTAVAQANPQFAPELGKAREAWRMFVRMREAAGGATSEEKFTPADLLRAVRRQESSPRARGDEPLRGYAEAAQAAFNGRTNPMELLHIFSRHGLPAELARQLVGPVGRMMKAASPVASPVAGLTAADVERGNERYNATRRGDLAGVRKFMQAPPSP